MMSLARVALSKGALKDGVCSLSTMTNRLAQAGKSSGGKSTAAPPPASSKNVDPPSNVFSKGSSGPLGPGASKEGQYKNPEYYSYHQMSYADMEVVMQKLRNPQPSAKGT